MYQAETYVIYGNMGVCRIAGIEELSFGKGGKKKHYVLEPQAQHGTIFIPVDTGVFMRPVISKEEADRLIDMIPSIRAEAFMSRDMKELAGHYSTKLGTHECEDLIEMTMSIYAKKQYREAQKQKFGVVDENYMKKAEDLLFSEFAVALGIPRDEIRGYIESRLDGRNPQDEYESRSAEEA